MTLKPARTPHTAPWAKMIFLVALGSTASAAPLAPDPPMNCSACPAWNAPMTPYRVFGNTWYVGTTGLSSLLVEAGEEDGRPALVLLDGALPQSAPLIDANIRVLGFDPGDIRVILNSHAHFDHAGGIAALQRATGARVIASEASASALREGAVPEHDPQAGYAPDNGFPPVDGVEALPDGAEFTVGKTTFTLNATPGHTPGGTSWSWETCDRGTCALVLYADSMNPVAAPGFRYSEPLDALRGASTGEQLRESIEFLRNFDCGVLLAPHPFLFGMDEKLARRSRETGDGAARHPFLSPDDCNALADRVETALEARLAQEAETPAVPQGPAPGELSPGQSRDRREDRPGLRSPRTGERGRP